MFRGFRALPLLALALAVLRPAAAQAQRLRLVEFSSDSTSYHVGSTLIAGPTEAILVDAQFHMSDARREADSIAALGIHLTAIFITHPDEDHYFGAEAFVQRFPGTPVYMTGRGLWEFRATARTYLAQARQSTPAEAPDSLVTPQLLPDTGLSVDGEHIEIVRDLQGDVLAPSNSFVWVPSLRAVLAGDIVFNHVHPWLAASDTAARRLWHESIRTIQALHPRIVVAAHKPSVGAPDTPDVLEAMDRYLTDFDAERRRAPNAQALIAAMTRKYPDWTVPGLLQFSSMAAYRIWGH